MKKIVYTCDKCRREIEGNPAKFFSETLDSKTGDFVYDDPHPDLKELDFCKECNDSLANLIRRTCEKGIPAVINKEFDAAVQEMVDSVKDTSDSDNPPPRRRRRDAGLTPGKSGRCTTQAGR